MPDLACKAAALALGALGGAMFHLLSLPLPWMLGALFATMTASIAGAPVRGPMRLRPAVVAVIGVFLGSRFTPAVLEQAEAALVTLAVLLAYLAAVAAVVVPWYRIFGRQDWTTAFFAGMPGGLSEMVELGEARGADPQAIVLAHSLRIVMTIALMVLLFRVVLDHDLGAGRGAPVPPALSLLDAWLLSGCAVVGAFTGLRLGLPAPTFLGPLILSAVAHLTGWTESLPPQSIVIAAQVALGTLLGCRFQGIPLTSLARAGWLSAGATLLTLALAGVAGLTMQSATGVGLDQAMLALAPGGLTEMGLIALAIHADVAFVALHHVVRILIVITIAPMLVRYLHRLP